MNATPDMYHAWLIRQRVYCERDACFRKPMCVMKYNGRDTVLCDVHANRLDAVRQSEAKQQETTKNVNPSGRAPFGWHICKP